MSQNTETAVVTANEPGGVVRSTANVSELVLQATAEQFEQTELSEMARIFESIKGKSLKNAEVASVNMCFSYLKFANYKDQPLRRYFMGWTASQLLDFKTKQPLLNEDGRPLYGPAVILYDADNETMQTNQAFEVVKFAHKNKLAHGTGIQITFKGLEATTSGNNKQVFDIRILSA